MQSTIKFGPLTGKYFSQNMVDEVLKPMAEEIERRVPAAEQFEIWYDARQDFHHLKFVVADRVFDVRTYKVLSVSINGKDGWVGCPSHRQERFVDYLVEQAK